MRWDIISAVLTCTSMLAVGHKKWQGWGLAFLNSVAVCILAVHVAPKQWALIPPNAFCLVIYTRKSYQLASRGRLPKDCAADKLRVWMACDIQGVAETSSQVRPASGLKLQARYFPIGCQICKWPRHHPALVTGVQLRSLGAPDKCTGRCSFSQSAQAKDSRAAGEFACNDSNSLTIDKAGIR
jgi:hypothetical protein